MQKHIVSLLAFVAVLGMLLPGGATYAQDERLSNHDASIVDPLLTEQTGTVGVLVELAGEPSMVSYARAKATNANGSRVAVQRLAEIEREQVRLVNELTALNAQVIYRTQRVYNGIAIYIDAAELEAVAKLSGVAAVRPLPVHTVDNAYSVQLIGAPELWAGLTEAGLELTGDGISIGIIDTGVDYIHADFGGPGTQAAYDANDTTIISDTIPGLGTFPTAKVVGGWDFVGDAYNGAVAGSMPEPDPDPMDCNGHGTHVAGTAAGTGTNPDGSTYTGAYNGAYDPDNFLIGPGVAPEADIYALRVFGCAGSTNVTVQAIEWAVDPDGNGDPSDHLDVINMSLGSPFGVSFDASAAASDNAVLAGVIVVASAGNSGDTYYITGAPAVSARAISVGSSVDSASVTDAIRVTSSPNGTLDGEHRAFFSVNYDWTGSPTNTQVVSGELYYTAEDACQPADLDPAQVSGKIVILRWADGQCGSVTRSANIRQAGAVGFLFADNSDVFDLLLSGDAIIPGASIPKEVGDALIAATQQGTVEVELDPDLLNNFVDVNEDLVDLLSAFSSRGPRRFDNALKPDLSAPGQSIFSAATGTGTGGSSLNGTSMAAPHIAGSAALMRQLHPAWDVEDIKALLMNTASNNLRSDIPLTSDLLNPSRIGAGRVDLVDAANSDVILYNADALGYVSVSFGAVEVPVSATAELSRTVWVENTGTTPVSYSVGYAPVLTIPGVTYSVEPAMVDVAAGEAVSLTVTMMADGNLMERTKDSTVAATQVGFPRHFLSEASGHITLNSVMNTMDYSAALASFNEVPTNASPVRAQATMMFDGTTLTYAITPSMMITPSAAHFHMGPAGQNGGVEESITVSGAYGPNTPIQGSVDLDSNQMMDLMQGLWYINIHTVDNPGGEIRGQVVAARPDLRLPVYANARPTSDMYAPVSELDFSGVTTATGAISLTGTGLDQGGYVSLVSAFELVDSFADQDDPASPYLNYNNADLQHLGITSNYTDTVTDGTEVYFGISTWGDWSTPREVTFNIYIDVDQDGTDDFTVFNTSLSSGNNSTDVFVTAVGDGSGNNAVLDSFLNAVPATTDTNVFNNRVMFLPVFAESIGLSATQTMFNYRVETFNRESNGEIIDETGYYTYDIANPTVDFMNSFVGPVYMDQPGEEIDYSFNADNNDVNGSAGILLLHHHNGGTDIDSQAIDFINVPGTDQYIVYLPIVRK